ncbi:MAG TPA: cyclic-di-AMP receptor [Chloroflexota bacterium]|jgi:uncharacterized protein YaaQ|nr:cyclic-di-AMP receptor [Chloroflexota bacterium]
MKLVCAIVSGTDADKITESLVSAGYPGPTRINTVGGFLRRGNATLLLGTDDERVEGAIDVIRSAVENRPPPEDPNSRRATIFVLESARFIRI